MSCLKDIGCYHFVKFQAFVELVSIRSAGIFFCNFGKGPFRLGKLAWQTSKLGYLL